MKKNIEKDVTFKDVVKMFDQLQKKGYSVLEIMDMPIFVGNNKKTKSGREK